MPNRIQRGVLLTGCVAILLAFAWQPKVDQDGIPVGFFPFYWSFAEIGARSEAAIFPNQAMLRAEYLVVAVLTFCAYRWAADRAVMNSRSPGVS